MKLSQFLTSATMGLMLAGATLANLVSFDVALTLSVILGVGYGVYCGIINNEPEQKKES